MSFIGDWAMTRSCTTWKQGDRDAYGNVTYQSPVFFDNVWFKFTNEKFIDSTGQERVSTFKLITRIENKANLLVNSFVVLDRNESATANPNTLSDAYQIKSVQVIAADAAGSVDAVIVMG